jgi:hypothetical protein
MEAFGIRPLSERDVSSMLEKCGGTIAHPDADRRAERGGDFIYDGAVIELKILDEDGLEKSDRQIRLATLFRDQGFTAPVVVLDRERLPEEARRLYDRAIEGPIKTAVASARRQLKQTRLERPDTSISVLWVLNNGYTALNHQELTALVERRVRNDTSNIDAVIVGGCYFHSDGFDSYFLWPLDHVPIRAVEFTGFAAIKRAWDAFATDFMTRAIRGDPDTQNSKGPVIDGQFEVHGTTYVKPAPPIGRASEFYARGRPRKDSSGLATCPPVALTFPSLTRPEWRKFSKAMPGQFELSAGFERWQAYERRAHEDHRPTQPLVRVSTTFVGWKAWASARGEPATVQSMHRFANFIFQDRIRRTIDRARELSPDRPVPPRFILAVTEEIGQDKANDLSHIMNATRAANGEVQVAPLVEDLRMFHEYALALASAYAVSMELDTVMWMRDERYCWA